MAKDGKMMEMITSELKKVGIEKDQVDDYMVWGLMKLSLGIMKIKWSLDENGIKGKEADDKLAAIVKMVSAKSADELYSMMHHSQMGSASDMASKGDNCGCSGKGAWKKDKE